jgi:RES domain-containing protein
MVYLAQNLSLAILELVVHLENDSDISGFAAIPVAFDSALVQVVPPSRLPENWLNLPVSEQSQSFGKQWLESQTSTVLQVPSSVVPNESNFLINPRHPEFSLLKIGSPHPLDIDQRITSTIQESWFYALKKDLSKPSASSNGKEKELCMID